MSCGGNPTNSKKADLLDPLEQLFVRGAQIEIKAFPLLVTGIWASIELDLGSIWTILKMPRKVDQRFDDA